MTSARPARFHRLLLRGAGFELALELSVVGRIEPIDELIAVPLASEHLLGLAEVRGRPVTLLDPAIWLGHEVPVPEDYRDSTYAFTFASPFDHLGLAVDERTALQPLGEVDPGIAPLIDRRSLEQSVERIASRGWTPS